MKIADNFSEGRLLAVCLCHKNANLVDLRWKIAFYRVFGMRVMNNFENQIQNASTALLIFMFCDFAF